MKKSLPPYPTAREVLVYASDEKHFFHSVMQKSTRPNAFLIKCSCGDTFAVGRNKVVEKALTNITEEDN